MKRVVRENEAKQHGKKAPSAIPAATRRTAVPLKTGRATPQETPLSFPVVAFGASAGEPEACTALFNELAESPGMAFVVVERPDPNQPNATTELLSQVTRMPVREVTDRMQLAPNTVYVAPLNSETTIEQGMLRLKSCEATPNHHMPIDAFLRSLAQDQKSNSIGVVLSGSGCDGTLGLGAVKSAGGITFALDPQSTKYDGMSKSAIASGYVDFVLAPESIARELLRIRKHLYSLEPGFREPIQEIVDHRKGLREQLNEIFGLLRQHRGEDFSEYKPSTIQRRILRRMALTQCAKLKNYLHYLHDHPDEIDALRQDLLINATQFFRDAEAFQALQEMVYPALMKDRPRGDAIRIWVPGCSTGEEAYSHAIALLECLGESRLDFTVQIFGTDLSEKAIQKARWGIYTESISANVSSPRLRRFFTAVEGGYRINKAIRDMCVFATHNVFSDPPFARMDLVSCRNLMIYTTPQLQDKLMPRLHYALKPAAFLMAGNTDDIGEVGAGLFEIADQKHRIYVKKAVSTPALNLELTRYGRITRAQTTTDAAKQAGPMEAPPTLQKEAEKLLLARYVSAAVVADDNLKVLQTRGRAGRYLKPMSGQRGPDLLKMARPGLMVPLQDTIRKARKEQKPVRKENIRVDQGLHSSVANIEVVPIRLPEKESVVRNFLIVFEDLPVPLTAAKKIELGANDDSRKDKVSRLEQELAATREYLRATMEDYEASSEQLQSANEELQTANEELRSTNEELHSTNEELRTTNEELQAFRDALESTHQELTTVHDTVKHRDLELRQANQDIVNIPLVMLGPDLCVRRYTPLAESALGLTSSDVGRPLTHLHTLVNVPDLEALLHDVMSKAKAVQREIQDSKGTWYRLSIMPYRTGERESDGAVLTLMDISDLKRSLGELATGREKLEETLRLMQNGLLVADAPSGKLQMGNNRLWEILGESVLAENNVLDYAHHAVDPDGFPLAPEEWPIARSMKGEVVTAEEVEWNRADGQHLFLGMNSAPIRDKAGKVVSVVATFIDMTYRHSAEDMLRVSEQMSATGRLAAALAHEINNPLEALTNLVYLISAESTIGKQVRSYVDMARVELDRIMHISKSLLGLYRAKSKTESFLIRDVINEVVELFAPRIVLANVRIVKRYEAEGEIHGSYTEMRQVFLNLVGNALEAVGQNGTVTVRTSASRDWGNPSVRGFRISVADRGVGIRPEHRLKLFEPFFTTKGTKGTGLGLWVSNGIIHRYGGSIRVRSSTTPGRSGTTFSIFLPNSTVKRSKARKDAPADARASLPQQTPGATA
jgi:two-component system CheB/CheR fusion protein